MLLIKIFLPKCTSDFVSFLSDIQENPLLKDPNSIAVILKVWSLASSSVRAHVRNAIFRATEAEIEWSLGISFHSTDGKSHVCLYLRIIALKDGINEVEFCGLALIFRIPALTPTSPTFPYTQSCCFLTCQNRQTLYLLLCLLRKSLLFIWETSHPSKANTLCESHGEVIFFPIRPHLAFCVSLNICLDLLPYLTGGQG